MRAHTHTWETEGVTAGFVMENLFWPACQHFKLHGSLLTETFHTAYSTNVDRSLYPLFNNSTVLIINKELSYLFSAAQNPVILMFVESVTAPTANGNPTVSVKREREQMWWLLHCKEIVWTNKKWKHSSDVWKGNHTKEPQNIWNYTKIHLHKTNNIFVKQKLGENSCSPGVFCGAKVFDDFCLCCTAMLHVVHLCRTTVLCHSLLAVIVGEGWNTQKTM